MELGLTALKSGYDIRALKTVLSTNIADYVPADSKACWITAKEQTAAKGRRGRKWLAPAGNLYASLHLRDFDSSNLINSLSFISAIAAYRAINTLFSNIDNLWLKWPNDINISNKKLGGILIEKPKPDYVIIGFGINVEIAPLNETTICLHEYDKTISSETLFSALSNEMSEMLAQAQMQTKHDYVFSDWLAKTRGIGQAIIARLENEVIQGIFTDLDDYGRLILTLPSGKSRLLSTGEIFNIY